MFRKASVSIGESVSVGSHPCPAEAPKGGKEQCMVTQASVKIRKQSRASRFLAPASTSMRRSRIVVIDRHQRSGDRVERFNLTGALPLGPSSDRWNQWLRRLSAINTL